MLSLADRLIEEGFTPYNIDELTDESILDNSVFEYIFMFEDHIQRTDLIVKLTEKARKLNVARSFNTKLKAHQTNYVQKIKGHGSNVVKFTDPPIKDLKCGKWTCDDKGVTKTTLTNGMIPSTETACQHPILPTSLLWNIEQKTEKVVISFFRFNKWMNVTVNKTTISNTHNIVNLADRGIAVNSLDAPNLISFLSDVISLNVNEIPQHRSISRLGWVENEFIPYVSDIKYDGDSDFANLYDCVKSVGDYTEWKKLCGELRQNKVFRLIMAGSFASALIERVGILPFVLHLWGGTGAGKTVALMVAMSIWGDPEMGQLVRSLNMTQNSMARTASFLYSIPFAGDELQILKSKWDNLDNLIMYVTEGIDRGRAKAGGGIEILKTWKNSFLFSGEEPIAKANSGGGVKNRIIEIETKEKLVEDGNAVSNFVRENFGFAGKEFIEVIRENDYKKRYREIHADILAKCNTTEKQAMAMAVMLLADEIAISCIFKGEEPLKIDDIKEFMVDVEDVDVTNRAYDWTINWIAQNKNRFTDDNQGEIWGKVDEMCCLVNKNVLVDHLHKNGFEFASVVSKWSKRGWIEKNTQGRNTHNTKAYGVKSNYVKVLLQSDFDEVKPLELPF